MKASGQYRGVWAKLIGVEMEASGVANARFTSGVPAWILDDSSVSDLADGEKNSQRVQRWRPYAREIAAAWTVDFLKSGPVPAGRAPITAARPRASVVGEGWLTALNPEAALRWPCQRCCSTHRAARHQSSRRSFFSECHLCVAWRIHNHSRSFTIRQNPNCNRGSSQ